MNYDSLINKMEDSVISGELKMAEDCLNPIQKKYSGQQSLNALNKYSSLLKNASSINNQDLIKKAIDNGELISTPTSFDLYSPKYEICLSKLCFDESGNLISKRNLKYKNQKSLLL